MFLNIEYEDAWTFINQLTGGCLFQKLPWASASLFNSRSARYLLYHPLVTTLPSGSSVERGKSPKTPPTYPAKMIMMPSKILILIHSAAAVCYSRCHWIFTYSIKEEEPFVYRSTLVPSRLASGSQVFQLTPAAEVSEKYDLFSDKTGTCCEHVLIGHVETQTNCRKN